MYKAHMFSGLGVYRPNLVLNFAGDKSLDPRITFTRASSGTYDDAAGAKQTASTNVARFTHDPVTLESLGLLIEESRTNLLLNSETLSTQNVTVSATAYTLSFQGTGTVTLSGTSSAGPLVGTSAQGKVSLTFTPTAGTLTVTVSGSVKYANIEAGSFATSWIPTTGTTATRAADSASMTGSNFSDWYNQSEGAFVAEYVATSQTLGGVIALTGGSLAANTPLVIMDNWPGDNVRCGIVGVAFLDTSGVQTTAGQSYKTAFALKTSEYASSTNGNAAQESASTNDWYQGATAINIGTYFSSGAINPLCSTIKSIAYYPKRLSNSYLQYLTS